jgi:hypothetical protein
MLKGLIEKLTEYAEQSDDKYIHDMLRWARGELLTEPILEDYSNVPILGTFEHFTKEEQAEIQDDGFAEFWEELCIIHGIKAMYNREHLQRIRNLCHHTWNRQKEAI